MHEGKYKYQITKQKLIEYARELPENSPLPNRNQLAKQCGVARVTLERAISELIGEGILISEDGKGTYTAGYSDGKKTDDQSCQNPVWALLLYSVTKGTAPSILRGVEDFANEHELSLIVCNTDNSPEKEAEYLKKVCRQNVGGVILIPSTHSVCNGEAIRALQDKKIPLVTCSRRVPGYDFPGTFQNFFQAGFMATQHLIQLGCRNIAYLATSRYSTIEDRLQGYLAALDQHNFQHPDDPVHEAMGLSDIMGDIEKLFEKFLRHHPEVDGIYVFNDRLAVILYRVLERLGRYPGEDIRVIASDDSGFSSSFSVALSTVDFPTYKMGYSVAEQLYDLSYGKLENSRKHVVLSCELNARTSTLGKK